MLALGVWFCYEIWAGEWELVFCIIFSVYPRHLTWVRIFCLDATPWLCWFFLVSGSGQSNHPGRSFIFLYLFLLTMIVGGEAALFWCVNLHSHSFIAQVIALNELAGGLFCWALELFLAWSLVSDFITIALPTACLGFRWGLLCVRI